jgi:hypothetical protein
MLYRIFTENTSQLNAVLDLVNAIFDGFTWYETHGVYKKQAENSICIEIESHPNDVKIAQLGRDICVANNQQCVLIQQIDTVSALIDQQGKLKSV